MKADARDWLEDAAVIRALLAEGQADEDGSQPIHRWIKNLEAVAKGALLLGRPEVGPDLLALAGLADIYGARMLAWSARVLLSRPKQVQIDKSLISRELAAADFTGEGGILMPGGVGTFLLAARCVHLEEGKVWLYGSGTTSKPDIRWCPERGGTVVFERKDRAFVRASVESACTLERTLIDRALEACRQLPEAPGTVRIAFVGAAAPWRIVDEIGPRFSLSIRAPFVDRHERGETIPDGVGLFLMGFEASTRAELLTSVVQFAPVTERTQTAWRALEEVFRDERLRASGALASEE